MFVGQKIKIGAGIVLVFYAGLLALVNIINQETRCQDVNKLVTGINGATGVLVIVSIVALADFPFLINEVFLVTGLVNIVLYIVLYARIKSQTRCYNKYKGWLITGLVVICIGLAFIIYDLANYPE